MSQSLKMKSLVRSSKISFQEIDDLVNFLNQLDEDSLATINDLFEKQPDWIIKFYQDIQNKKIAFDKKDKQLWDKIIKKEEQDLLKI